MNKTPQLKALVTALFLTAALPSSATRVLTANENWNTSQYLSEDVVIPAGFTLSITGSSTVITCAPGVFIKVMTNNQTATAGGRLIITDATLTAAPNSEWYGIYTVGNKNISQGDVRMSKTTLNNATIEKSMYGVRNWDYQSDLWASNTGGGIVQVKNSKFHNNSFGVYLHSYQNFSRFDPSQKMADYSYVYKSRFYFDATTNLAGGSGSCIHLHDVDGVQIKGNTFSCDPSSGWFGNAIYLENSGASIQPYCNDNVAVYGQPCSDETPNIITGFWRAIYAPGTGGAHKVIISKNSIASSSVGIYMSGYANTQILKNTIDLPANSSGISLEGCTGFRVEENVIHGTGAASSNGTFGIMIKNAGESYNEVYKNEIVNTAYALQANDNNRGIQTATSGLTFLCNTMTNTIGDAYDITVNGGTSSLTSGIAYYQGGFNGTSLTAGNTFSSFTTTTGNHNFNNSGNSLLYYADPGAPATTPTYHNVTIMTGAANTCPTKIIPPGVATATLEQLSTSRSLLEASIDGHITDGTDYSGDLVSYRQVINEMMDRYQGTFNGEDEIIQPEQMISLLGSTKYLYDFKIMKATMLAQYGSYDDALETMDAITSQFELNELQQLRVQNIRDMIAFRQSLEAAENDWSLLSQEQKDVLHKMADDDDFMARDMARYYLSAYEGEVYMPDLRTITGDVAVPAQPISETIAMQLNDNIKVYPNPAVNELTISLRGYTGATVVVADITGRIVLKSALSTGDNHLDIQNLHRGVYFVCLQTPDGKTRNYKVAKK